MDFAARYHTVITVVFFVAFNALLVWVYWPSNKQRLESQGVFPDIEGFSHKNTPDLAREKGNE